MTGEERERRDSRALEPELITDPQAKAAAEARNGFRQYDAAIGTIQSALERGSFKLRPSLILGLQREALAGISSYAGNTVRAELLLRAANTPVGAHLVPELIEDMWDDVNDHWEASTPLHLAAYLMWRLNWIHPFADGNGRTSRIVSYVALSIRAGAVLPGEALDAADCCLS
jgi:Fic family protein